MPARFDSVQKGEEMAERAPRSVSQFNQYTRCPMAYKLSRIDKVWQRPAAWLPQGTAVHSVADVYEKRKLEGTPMSLDEALDLFREEFANDCNAYCEVTPNFQFWSRSGPYGGAQDIERRFEIGLEQVEKLIGWTDEHPDEKIWIAPDGTPGIELSFEIDLGGVPVRGFIDAVVWVDGQLRVRDYKTGNTPGDDFQLGVYSVALEVQYGIERPVVGDYFMAGKKGKKARPTDPYDLSEWTRERVTEEFHKLEANIQAERFDPLPEPSKCLFCDVNASCTYALG